MIDVTIKRILVHSLRMFSLPYQVLLTGIPLNKKKDLINIGEHVKRAKEENKILEAEMKNYLRYYENMIRSLTSDTISLLDNQTENEVSFMHVCNR